MYDSNYKSHTVDESRLRNITLIAYLLQAASFLLGFTILISVIVCYVKKEDARGTLYYSHFRWMIFTFWVTVIFFVLGMLLFFIGPLSWLIITGISIWLIYRIIKGLLYWYDRRSLDGDVS